MEMLSLQHCVHFNETASAEILAIFFFYSVLLNRVFVFSYCNAMSLPSFIDKNSVPPKH